MPDVFIRIVHFDPLLSNAEAEWFKDQFERIAAAHGFPIAREPRRPRLPDQTPEPNTLCIPRPVASP